MGERSEYSIVGWLLRSPVWVGRTQSLVGESEKRCGPKSRDVWLLGCCDASDVIDAEERIISNIKSQEAIIWTVFRQGVGGQ